jgi:hypothetical protein
LWYAEIQQFWLYCIPSVGHYGGSQQIEWNHVTEHCPTSDIHLHQTGHPILPFYYDDCHGYSRNEYEWYDAQTDQYSCCGFDYVCQQTTLIEIDQIATMADDTCAVFYQTSPHWTQSAVHTRRSFVHVRLPPTQCSQAFQQYQVPSSHLRLLWCS